MSRFRLGSRVLCVDATCSTRHPRALAQTGFVFRCPLPGWRLVHTLEMEVCPWAFDFGLISLTIRNFARSA